MATCKDCIHYEVCKDYIETLAKAKNADLEAISKWLDEMTSKSAQTDCECEHFKNHSRFVELPYSLSEGDKLKYIFTDENNEIRIGDDWEVVTKICKDGFFVTGRINSDGTYQAGDYFYPWSAIGTEYFLTKEQAEQALRERERE